MMPAEEFVAARAEEQSRLAALYANHAPASVRLAYLLTGNAATAEDLVQDAFVHVAGRFRHLRDEGAFAPYLRKTVVNLARMHFRRTERERARLTRHGLDSHPGSPDVEMRDQIVTALAGLPERQRAALVLRFYEELSEAETADALGCRPGTVKSLTSRGLQALRAKVER